MILDETSHQLQKNIGPQVGKGSLEETVVDIARETTQISTGVIYGQFALNFFLAASLQKIWSMINVQQLIVLMTLF